MIKAYEAIMTHDELGYSIEFPDISGCSTQANDLKEAYAMAYDVLGLVLQQATESGRDLPEPTYGHVVPDGGRLAVIVMDIAALDFTEKYVTVGEASDMLSVSSQRIQALIKSGDIASEKIGITRFIVQKSVREYRDRRAGAGRPRKAVSE